MNAVVENLILVLPRSIVDTAVAAFGNLPMKSQFEVVGDFIRFVNEATALTLASDHSVFDFPVAFVFPVIAEALAIKERFKTTADSASVSELTFSAIDN